LQAHIELQVVDIVVQCLSGSLRGKLEVLEIEE
jgi:hypothetical protein